MTYIHIYAIKYSLPNIYPVAVNFHWFYFILFLVAKMIICKINIDFVLSDNVKHGTGLIVFSKDWSEFPLLKPRVI